MEGREIAVMLPGQHGGAAPAEYEIITYLLEDIARLPIISNRAQELWLGIQLRAARRLTEGGRRAERRATAAVTPAAVARAFAAAVERLTAEAPAFDPAALARWAAELLLARRDVYRLQHSRLRRRLDALAGRPDGDAMAPLFHETVEWLALLPDALPQQLADTPPDALPDLEALPALLPPDQDAGAYAAWVEATARRARQTLVTGYLRYAVRVARGAVGEGLPFSDLAQHGFMGLMRAADRFDYRVNARFGTYATSWIWQGVTRGVAEEANPVRLPIHIRDKLDHLARLVARRDPGWGDPLADPALLAEAGFLDERRRRAAPVDVVQRRVRRLVLQAHAHLSFDGTEAAHAAPANQLVDAPDGRFDAPRLAADRLLAVLSRRQREVLELRYGLTDGRARTLEEVGRALGVTRERIRQIEAAAMRKLEGRLLSGALPVGRDVLLDDAAWSIPRPPLPPVYPAELLGAAQRADDADWVWLDRLLERLPHSHWHAARSTRGVDGGRAGQLAQALLSLGGPAHFTRIVEAANEAAAARRAIEEATAYNVLVSDERVFLLLGEGVFSLVEWERARAAEARPQLPFCPVALPDPPGFEGALFESVFVGRDQLAAEPTAADFLDAMLRWAEADPLLRGWQRQGILATYYLLGLLPYVCIAGGDNPRLRATLPAGDAPGLRRHCLQTLTERLAGMPEFWSALRAAQPIRAGEMGERQAEWRPDGPDDAARRLRLLGSLGAVARSPAGYYRLTPLGDSCAAAWAREPEEAAVVAGQDGDPVSDLSEWGLW